MRAICDEWLKVIKIGEKTKEERFGKYAREASKFYDGAHDWMWESEYSRGSGGFLDKSASRGNMPTFRMTVNRVFEAVALFGPALYHQYPKVMVTTVKTPEISPEALGFNMLNLDPQQYPMQAQQIMEQQQVYAGMQQQKQMAEMMKGTSAKVKQHVLNWLQIETNKKVSSRRSIVETIYKGAGYLFTEMHTPRGSNRKYPLSRHISCDDIIKDPDASYNEDVQWIAIHYTQPVNLTERKFGLRRGELKGNRQSYNSQVSHTARKEAKNNKVNPGDSYDLIEYYEIFSKNGFGDRLKSTNKQSNKSKFDFDEFGDFCRIVVSPGIPFPLNIPTSSLMENDEQLFMRSQWPIPFWTDEMCGNGWPLVELGFYEKAGCVWPISMIKPAIGELRFVNWCMSFLADKVAAACVDYVVVLKEAGMEIQDQLQGQMAPYTVMEISKITGKSINDVVSFLKAPQFSSDIWTMVGEVLELIDKRLGLTELVYGLTGTQIRSAQEASIKEQNINIRPDDMATKTEEFLSDSAMKEIQAAVWGCEGKDLQGVLGDEGAYVWDNHIRTMDPEDIVRDYKYRIEAGSARKPNKANRLRSLSEFSQTAMPMIQEFAGQGIVDPWNALVNDYAEAMDLNAEKYLVQLPEPDPEQGPDPEQMKAEMEMKMKEMDMAIKEKEFEMKEKENQQELRFKKELHEQAMKFEQEKAKIQKENMKAQVENTKSQKAVA